MRGVSLPNRQAGIAQNARNPALASGAIGLLGDFLAAGPMSEGRLVRILPDYETLAQPIYAVIVHRTYMPAKIRALIDYLTEVLGPPTPA